MAISSYKLGPGTLLLGTDPDDLDATAQVTACTVSADENVDSEDDVDVLSGETLDGEDDVSLDWTIAGSVLQDTLAAAGLVAFTWDNASEIVSFKFVPSTAAGRQVSGLCRVIPLAVGGDVKARAASDFSWAVIGTPVLGAAA